MQRELLDRANEINRLIEENERSIKRLEEHTADGVEFYIEPPTHKYLPCDYLDRIYLEPWEIRLMIHNKKQRLNALKAELERL